MKKRPSEPNPVGQLRELREGYIAERHGHRRRQLDYMVAAFRSYLKLKDSPGRIKSFYKTISSQLYWHEFDIPTSMN